MLFIKKFATFWVQLICLSLAVYNRPRYNESLLKGIKPDTGEPDSFAITRLDKWSLTLEAVKESLSFRYCFEVATILSTLEYVLVQQGEEIKNSGIDSFYRNLVKTV